MLLYKMSFEKFFSDGYPVNQEGTLFIIMDGDNCRVHHHELHSVPLLIEYCGHREKVDGQYCWTCRQAQILRNRYAELYQEYGKPCCTTILKGFEDVVWDEVSTNYPESLDAKFKERAPESRLRKLGYSVASTSDLSDAQRQALLRNAIRSGAVTKGYVVQYLSHMIEINGKKPSNQYACEKWKSDLDFVLRL